MSNYLMVIPGAAVVVLGAWTWALHLRQQRRIETLEGRVANLLAGLSLLTDTTESGLREVTAEVARLSSGDTVRPRPRAATSRRVSGAARRGQTVQQIAAAEQMSEGEVKLRLSMNGGQTAQDGHRAEVC